MVGTDTVSMGQTIHAGLAVSPNQASALSTVKSDNVSITTP